MYNVKKNCISACSIDTVHVGMKNKTLRPFHWHGETTATGQLK